MSRAQSFSDWLTAEGHVPAGVDVPRCAGIGAVTAAVGRQTGPGREDALALWRQLGSLFDLYCAETGAPRVTVVRASPMPEHSRRTLAGVLAGALC